MKIIMSDFFIINNQFKSLKIFSGSINLCKLKIKFLYTQKLKISKLFIMKIKEYFLILTIFKKLSAN